MGLIHVLPFRVYLWMINSVRKEKTPIGSHRPHIDPLSNVPVGVRSFFSLNFKYNYPSSLCFLGKVSCYFHGFKFQKSENKSFFKKSVERAFEKKSVPIRSPDCSPETWTVEWHEQIEEEKTSSPHFPMETENNSNNRLPKINVCLF